MTITDMDTRPESDESITGLLVEAQAGEDSAWNRIYGLVYADLHRIARSQVRQRSSGRISATSLVARAMRFVLMDEVRKEMSEKRGDGQRAFALDEAVDAVQDTALVEMIALDAALTRLSKLDPRLAQLVEMRYFGGLDEDEIAHLLGVTDRTLRRDWRRARAFLLTQLGDRSADLLERL